MKILHLQPKKILCWDFFAFSSNPDKASSNSDKVSPKTAVFQKKGVNFFLEPLKCLEFEEKYYLLDGYQRWRFLEKENDYPFLVFSSFSLEELWLTKLFNKCQKLNLFELAENIKIFAKFLKISEIELWHRLDFKPIFSNINLFKLVLEMGERKQILQKFLPAEKWSLQTYKVFRVLDNKAIEKLQQKFASVRFNANEWKQILGFLVALKRVKKVSFLELLDLIEAPAQLPEYSPQKRYDNWCRVLFALSNPIAHKIQQQRKEKILNLKLIPQIKLNYASDFEKKELNFCFKTKNSNEFKKILLFLQNKLNFAESQVEDLYKII